MMRSILGMLALVLLFAPMGVAGEAEYVASLTPEQVARSILEGRQTFIAQYLQQADAAELLKIQKAICRLAPEIVDEARARPPVPSIADAPDGPLELVNIEVRVLGADVPKADGGSSFFRDVGIQWGPNGDVQMLEDTQVEVILRAVEKSERLTQITAPRITVYDRQRAEVSIINQISYVMDYDVEVAHGGLLDDPILDPIIGVLQEGLALTVTPTLSQDRKYISLELAAMQAEVRKPILEHEIECGASAGGPKVKIQVPHTDFRHARISARLPDGGTMLVRTGMTLGEEKEVVACFLLVRATVVQIDGAALKRELQDVEKKLKDGVRKPAGKPAGR